MSSYAFNPFTSNLDIVGSGASYIDGVVADPTALPVTVGTPALDSVYLAKAGSGVWLINRKPAGLYCRVANNGNANDWVHLGAFPEVNADGNWELYNSADPTKELKFDLSGISTGTTRTITVPNKNITLDDASDARPPTAHNHAASAITSGVFDNARINFAAPDAIGSTTRNSGAFTTLSANNGTVTTSTPALTVTQVHNNAAMSADLCRLEVSGSSSSVSPFINFINNGSGVFSIRRTGVAVGAEFIGSNGFRAIGGGNGGGQVILTSPGYYCWNDSTTSTFGTIDLLLRRDAAGILAQHNLANPQAFRIYNTTDAGLTNFERGFMRWSSNVLQIGTEAGGTGSNRAVEFVQGGLPRLSVTAGGLVEMGAQTSVRFGNNLLINGGAIQLGNTGAGDAFQINRDGVGTMALRNGTQPHTLRIYNTVSGTGNVNFERANLRWATNEFIIDAEAGGTGTSLRGMKIGSATSSLLGFYGVTPVDQPATVADPAGGGTVDTEARTAINAIIDRLQELGLIA